MAETRGSYPHPVLDMSDDVESTFEMFNVTVVPAVEDVQVRFQMRLDDPTLMDLLDGDAARLSFRWSCSATIASGELRPIAFQHFADSVAYEATIDQQNVRGTVRVEVKIVATVPIDEYALARQHSDYGSATFRVLPGDILADAGWFEFPADKLFDPLNPPVSSFMRFISDSTVTRGVKVRFIDDDYIDVVLPPVLLNGLAALGHRPDLQISLVVLPALMSAVEFIRASEDPSQGDDLSDKPWAQCVLQLMEQAKITPDESAFASAQKILSHPLDLTLTRALEPGDDDDE